MRRSLVTFLLCIPFLAALLSIGGCADQHRSVQEAPDDLVVNPAPTRKLTITGTKDPNIYLGFRLDFGARNEQCKVYFFPTGRLPPVRYLVVDAKERKGGEFEVELFIDHYAAGNCDWQAGSLWICASSVPGAQCSGFGLATVRSDGISRHYETARECFPTGADGRLNCFAPPTAQRDYSSAVLSPLGGTVKLTIRMKK
jgi:hypothetical protein